jgi:hypothetical protein
MYTKRKELPPALNALFSTPSLMNGEDAQAYAELYAWVEEVAQPRNVLDLMLVADVVNHFWEQQRYRRCTGAIINSRRRPALLKILTESIGLNPHDAMDLADIYFAVVRWQEDNRRTAYSDPAQIPNTRSGIIRLLMKHGFTETDIDRVAMEFSIDTLAAIENLALKHELRREVIMSELERRREHRARQQLSAASRQLDGGARAVTTRPPVVKDRSETEDDLDTPAPFLIEPS